MVGKKPQRCECPAWVQHMSDDSFVSIHGVKKRSERRSQACLALDFSASERFDGRMRKSSKRMADVDYVARFSRDAVDAVLAEVDRELAKCVSRNVLRDQPLDRAR
jgi:hypothetical protein